MPPDRLRRPPPKPRPPSPSMNLGSLSFPVPSTSLLPSPNSPSTDQLLTLNPGIDQSLIQSQSQAPSVCRDQLVQIQEKLELFLQGKPSGLPLLSSALPPTPPAPTAIISTPSSTPRPNPPPISSPTPVSNLSTPPATPFPVLPGDSSQQPKPIPWSSDQLQLLSNHLDLLLLKPPINPSSHPSPTSKTYASCLSHPVFPPPPSISPPAVLDGKLTISIPQVMINSSKQSFAHSAIGKFVGRRPSLEALEQWVASSWRLSRPCLISLTENGNFIFRFYSKEDKEMMIGHSPLLMAGKKMILRSWSPGQEETSWPSEVPVWVRLKGLPYHCWSSDILLSIAASIGPLDLPSYLVVRYHCRPIPEGEALFEVPVVDEYVWGLDDPEMATEGRKQIMEIELYSFGVF